MRATEKARWYAQRLAAMSGPEIAHRGREAARKRIGKHVTTRVWMPKPVDAPLPDLSLLRTGLLGWHIPASLLAEWRAHAAEAEAGTLQLLGQRWPSRPLAQRWHLDPVTGQNWPCDTYCHDIEFRHQSAYGDVKYVWELGRLQYLQPIAALAFKTGDASLAQLCVDHVESWIDGNPFADGVAWASGIELAFRVVSLVVICSLVGDRFNARQRTKLWRTLQAHGIWLERFPSLYSSANNHRLAEGLGLFVLGGLCPSLTDSVRWCDAGWSILCTEAERQILQDGVGAEQSVAYTSVVLEILLLGLVLARELRLPVPDVYTERLRAAGDWLRWCTDAAGNLPRIGDADDARVIGACRTDEEHTKSVLSCLAAVLNAPELTPPKWQPDLRHALFGFPPAATPDPSGVRTFSLGGYSIARQRVAGRQVLAAFDHGDLGFLSIAAHGHADALSIWLHIDGLPVLVDAGTFLYHAGGDWRRYFRGTAAHNTVRLNEAEASLVAGHFNWAHKARARLLRATHAPGSWSVEGEHDGYAARLGTVHRRRVSWDVATEELCVTDQIDAPTPLQAEIGFLLHPSLRARESAGGFVVYAEDGAPVLRLAGPRGMEADIAGPTVPGGWYSPSFGVKHATTRLCWRGVLEPNRPLHTRLRVEPADVREHELVAAPALEPAIGHGDLSCGA